MKRDAFTLALCPRLMLIRPVREASRADADADALHADVDRQPVETAEHVAATARAAAAQPELFCACP